MAETAQPRRLTAADKRRAASQHYHVQIGQTYWFEYHCWESDTSADADLWYHSHQQCRVLWMEDTGDGKDIEERGYNGHCAAYKVEFKDGFRHTATEDELLVSPKEYTQDDPPLPPDQRKRQPRRTNEANDDINRFLSDAGVIRGDPRPFEQVVKKIKSWPEFINANESATVKYFNMGRFYNGFVPVPGSNDFRPRKPGLTGWEISVTYWYGGGSEVSDDHMNYSITKGFTISENSLVMREDEAKTVFTKEAVTFLNKEMDDFIRKLTPILYKPYRERKSKMAESVVSVLLDGDQGDDMLSHLGQKALDVPYVKARQAFVRALKLPGDELRRFSPDKWMDSELHERGAWFAVMEALGMERELYNDVRSLVNVLANAGANSVIWPWDKWDKLAERTLDYSWFEVLPPSVAQAIKSLFIARYRPPINEE